jgi:hypothetical protein
MIDDEQNQKRDDNLRECRRRDREFVKAIKEIDSILSQSQTHSCGESKCVEIIDVLRRLEQAINQRPS